MATGFLHREATPVTQDVMLEVGWRWQGSGRLKMALPRLLALSFLARGTHVGLRAAVKRGPYQGARSGSTGPAWIPPASPFFPYSLLVKRRSRTWGVLVVLEPEDVVMQVILAAQGDEVQKWTKQLRG